MIRFSLVCRWKNYQKVFMNVIFTLKCHNINPKWLTQSKQKIAKNTSTTFDYFFDGLYLGSKQTEKKITFTSDKTSKSTPISVKKWQNTNKSRTLINHCQREFTVSLVSANHTRKTMKKKVVSRKCSVKLKSGI